MAVVHQIEICTAQGQDLDAAATGVQVRVNDWLKDNSDVVDVKSIELYFPPGDRNLVVARIHYTQGKEGMSA